MMDKIRSPKLICVEGRDEVNFFTALLTHLDIVNVQILDFEGKSKYKTKIPALINMPAFTSLCGILVNSGLNSPEMDQGFSNGNPKIGIFIMPGNNQTGALEDLCLESVASEDTFSCVEKYFDCIKTKLNHTSKAKVQCYLAGKDPHSNALGLAALMGHWDFSKESFNELRAFIETFR